MIKNCFLILITLSVLLNGIAFSSETENINIHGFISQGYLKSNNNDYIADTEEGTFQFNEMGINFRSYLTPNFFIGTQFLARDIGPLGNDNIYVDWAFADYFFNNLLGIRTGILRAQIGLMNKSRDVDAVRTCILLPGSTYNERLRDIYDKMKGVALYGRFPGSITYYVSFGTTDVPSDSGWAYVMEDLGEVWAQKMNPALSSLDIKIKEIRFHNGVNAMLEWEIPLSGLKVTWTYYGGKVDLLTNAGFSAPMLVEVDNLYGQILSAQYYVGETLFSYEHFFSHVGGKLNNTRFSQDFPGWYASVSHRFLSWFEMSAYYSESYFDGDDKDGDFFSPYNHMGWEKDICLTARFDINSNWIFKLEVHRLNGTLNAVQTHPEELSKRSILMAAKMTYFF